ncbi:MAG: tetratricopeptide repeat protein, partial [Deltaproteobacteria bacterium]|nr:tetratricopeptide repeat protein [Deltaproteobacteria bacterium]
RVADRAPPPAPVAPRPAIVPSPPAAVAAIGRARYTVARDGADLTVSLADGEVALVVAPGEVIALATADGEVTLRGGRALVRARAGVIAQVAVFAGSAEILAPSGRAAIVAGDVWVAPPPLPPEPAPAPARGVRAFRVGWLAFRAARWTEAAAAFDRATDPAVREDAAFWAAVAHQRAGDAVGARARFAAFVAAFPDSSHRVAAERGAARD